MKSYRHIHIAVITLFAVQAMLLGLAAQDATTQAKTAQHHHYKLIDLGTLGGPSSYVPGVFYEIDGGTAGAQVISNLGAVAGTADTSIPDPLCFFDDCFYPHTFAGKTE